MKGCCFKAMNLYSSFVREIWCLPLAYRLISLASILLSEIRANTSPLLRNRHRPHSGLFETFVNLGALNSRKKRLCYLFNIFGWICFSLLWLYGFLTFLSQFVFKGCWYSNTRIWLGVCREVFINLVAEKFS